MVKQLLNDCWTIFEKLLHNY